YDRGGVRPFRGQPERRHAGRSRGRRGGWSIRSWLIPSDTASRILAGHDGGITDIAWERNPIVVDGGGRTAVDSDAERRFFARRAEAEADGARRIATRATQSGCNLALVSLIDNRGVSEIRGGVFHAAFFSRFEPVARDGLADQQVIAVFAKKQIAEPTAGVGFVGGLVMVAAPISHFRQGVFGIHVDIW